MKKMILSVLALGFSSSVLAANLVTIVPHIHVDQAKMSVSVDKFCVDGDMLRTGMIADVCTDYSNGEEPRCLKTKKVAVETSRYYQTERCVEWGSGEGELCKAYKTVTITRPLTYTYEVYESTHGDRVRTLVDSYDYTIPACE